MFKIHSAKFSECSDQLGPLPASLAWITKIFQNKSKHFSRRTGETERQNTISYTIHDYYYYQNKK